jgi:hydrogenase nickel incorporation protein HypB
VSRWSPAGRAPAGKSTPRCARELDLDRGDVGNLVCRRNWHGERQGGDPEHHRGRGKPIKYPTLFREAKACVLTKADLLPHLPFEVDACLAFIRQVNARLPVFQVSALKGRGMKPWVDWLVAQHQAPATRT